MKKKLIIVLLIIIVIIAIYFLLRQYTTTKYPEHGFPSTPTQQEIEKAKKLPKELCPCWASDGKGGGECLPQQACI